LLNSRLVKHHRRMQRDPALRELKREVELLRRQHAQDQISIQDMLFELGRIAAEHPELDISLRGRKKRNASDRPILEAIDAGTTLPPVRAPDLPRVPPRPPVSRRVVRAGRRPPADAPHPPLPQVFDGKTTWEQEALPFERGGLTRRELPTTPDQATQPQGEPCDSVSGRF